jgi:hypothetical protein
MWGTLSDERTDLSFATAAGLRQHNHSWVWVLLDSWLYFAFLDSRLPPPGRPGPPIYIRQEQCDSIIPPGTGFPLVASYDSQGYGGSIWTCLHMGFSFYLTTVALLIQNMDQLLCAYSLPWKLVWASCCIAMGGSVTLLWLQYSSSEASCHSILPKSVYSKKMVLESITYIWYNATFMSVRTSCVLTQFWVREADLSRYHWLFTLLCDAISRPVWQNPILGLI